jgi:epoxyqueuosine reductase
MKPPVSTAAHPIKDIARSLGFDLVSFTNVDVPESDRDFFLEWCRRGNAADMAWLTRDPARRAEPRTLLSGALGVITLGVSYFQGPLPPPPGRPAGRVARYAWGEDYHDVLERRLDALQAELAKLFGGDFHARRAVDAQPLLERAFARRAGLGFAGKNTNLIAPRAGSWIFLTELIVNVDLPADPPVAQGCGECRECQTACPTDALAVPFQLNARECIAYHTIENRGWIPAASQNGELAFRLR